jgi:aspartyl-tRNA(Asn)/glutamyl-tRNA(Gln) amidotransferase subunit A
VADAALVYKALLNKDPNDEATLTAPVNRDLTGIEDGVKGLRIGIPEDLFFEDLDPDVERATSKACKVFESLGAHLSRVTFPEAIASEALGATISGAEACVTHEDRLENQVEEMDTIVGPRMLADRDIAATDYIKAVRTMNELRRSSQETLRDIDLLLVPTTPIPALPLSQVDADLKTYNDYARIYARNTRVGNILDLCGLALPCGATEKGLPISLMIYGKPFTEGMVLRAGQAYENATDWHKLIPDLSWVQ